MSKSPTAFLLVFLLLGLAFSGALAFHSYASSGTLVQTNSEDYGSPGGSTPSTSESVAFSSSVTSGNVVVVAISDLDYTPSVSSVTDTLGSSFVSAGSTECYISAGGCVSIYYATLHSSGADTVTVSVSASEESNDIFIFEVSGITTVGASYQVGTSGSSQTATMSTSSASFSSDGFLLSVGETSALDSFTAGSGFTLASQPVGDEYSIVQTSTSGVASPTAFPMTISSGSDYWVYAGVAFNAYVPSVPEFPILQLSLPLLFLAGVVLYLMIRRRVIQSHSKPSGKTVF